MMSLPSSAASRCPELRGWVTPPPIANPGFPHPRPASTWGEYGGGGEGKGSGGGKTAQIPVLEAGDSGEEDSKVTAER